jgi:hypothetical protein
VYALGYFDHVLYQYNLDAAKVRSLHVGSVGGHVSRNLLCDSRGHAYVPRLRAESKAGDGPRITLAEFDAQLQKIGETPLEHYMRPGDLLSHGIVGFQTLKNGDIVFATHMGFLYRVRPLEGAPAAVEPLGWFHPRGESYTPSMFSYGGERWLVGGTQANPFEWVVFDLQSNASSASPLPRSGGYQDLLLYGSETADDLGNFYLVGAYKGPDPHDPQQPSSNDVTPTKPIVFQIRPMR